jgi:peptidoglycan hydrolase-like protein with peptidoglycan-binding domain
MEGPTLNRKLGHGLLVAVVGVAPLVTPHVAAPVAAVSCTVTVSLRPGTVNPAVACLEQRLIELGSSNIVGPDNAYDSASVAAVIAFQSSRGLHEDGIVGSITGRQLGLRGPLAPAGSARVTVIGDSTSAAIRWYDDANNQTTRYDELASKYDTILSVESCRRLVNPSCVGRNDPVTGQRYTPTSVLPLMKGALHNQLGEALVIMAGYDDTSIVSAIDSIMAEAKAQGVAKVFWLNYRNVPGYAYSQYYSAHNAALASAKVRYSNLVILDWNGYTTSQSAATQDLWFEADQIHISAVGSIELSRWIAERIDSEHIELCEVSHAKAGVPDLTTGTPTPAPAADTGFVGMQPVRVLDTRSAALGGGAGKMQSSSTIEINLAGRLPANATQAVLNVTAVDPCGWGYLTVFACGTRPNTSNVNYEAGRTTAALALTLLTNERLCIYSFAETDIVVDLIGSFTPQGDYFHPLGPVRWVDTRGSPAVFSATGPLTAGMGIDVPIAGLGGVPADAKGVWINLTATGSPNGAVWQAYPGPCGPSPNSSTVNLYAGRSTATSTLLALGTNGGICVQAYSGSGHAIVDVSGWFGGAGAGGLALRSAPPVRVIDTRGGAVPAANAVVSLAAPQVGVYNTTAVGAAGFGFVSAIPCGSTLISSLVNTTPLETFSNLGTVAPGAGGLVCFSPSVAAHLVVDQLGAFVVPNT